MSLPPASLTEVLAHIDATLPATTGRWFDLLRIPSVSAQPAHRTDCAAAAEWCRRDLTEIGFTAEIHPTPGHPVVVAHHPAPPGAPTLLFYGHYDVQPAEPLELWTSPPFEPTMVEGPYGRRAVARGAVDDKGQVMMWLAAFRAWHEVTGSLPVGVTVLLEGEEEVGSPNLEAFLQDHAEVLHADVAVISDTNMWDVATPAITTRLRGLVYVELCVKAAARDLHSGLFGGSALNAINALTRVLGDLHDPQGRVLLPGFYDGVRPVSNAQAAQWDELGFDEKKFLGDIGLAVPVGEVGMHPLVRLWARPTADINGIWGGYTGAGAKTVIPAEARAKISFRLVRGQVPETVLEQFRRFVSDRLPDDATAEFEVFGLAQGIEVPTDSSHVAAATAALADEFGRPAVLIGSGGSIPVADSFKRILALDTLLMGFGLDDDQVHSPNEKFELSCLHHGARSHARLLAKLSPPSSGG